MLSIQVTGGEAATVRSAAHVAPYKRATSPGGVESLIEHCASIDGEGCPAQPTCRGCPPATRMSTIGMPTSTRRNGGMENEGE